MSKKFDNPSAEMSSRDDDDGPHRLFLSASGTVVSAPSSTLDDDDDCAKNESKKSLFDSDSGDEEEESGGKDEDEAVIFPVVQMVYDVRNKMKDLRDQLGLENPRARIKLDERGSRPCEKKIAISEKVVAYSSREDNTKVSISEYCAIVKIAMLDNIIEWIDAQMAYVTSAHGDDIRTNACTHVCVELMQRWELISCVHGEKAKEDEIGQLTAYFPLLSTKENTDPEKAWKFMMRYQTSEDNRYTICYVSMIQNIETDWLTPVVPSGAYSSEEEHLALSIKPKFWRPVFSGHMWSPYQLYHAGDKMWRNFDLKPNAPIYRQFKPIDSCIFDVFTLSLLGYGSMQAHKNAKYNFPVGTKVVHRKVVPNIADGRQVVKQLIQALVERRLEDTIDENECLKEDKRHSEPEQERPNNVALFDAIDTKGYDVGGTETSTTLKDDVEDINDEEFRRKVAKSDRNVRKLQHLIGRLEESDVPGHIELPPSLISTVYLIPNKTNARQTFVRAVMEIVSHTMLTRQKYSPRPDVDDISEKMSTSCIADDNSPSAAAVAASSGEVNPFSVAANCEDDDD